MKHFLIACFVFYAAQFIALPVLAQQTNAAWVPDAGDGNYKNPVLYADYSDPDVIQFGNTYYMTSSSFNCSPGLPILQSKDLVNWQLVNYALPAQVPLNVFATPQHGKGVWAPSFAQHHKWLYIFYPDPDYGIYMIKTQNPLGAWSSPVLVLPAKGIIDPSCIWDDAGKPFLIVGWAGSRAGVKSLLTVFALNDSITAVTDAGRHVYDGHGIDPTVEGPKFYKRNGYYYIFCPAGGVATGWQLALRSKNIYGPYERKVVMQQGSTTVNGPHQGALVTAGNKDWFFHFQDLDAYGRIVHLQPVIWKNNWPVIGQDADGDGTGEPVLKYAKPIAGMPLATPLASDEFNGANFGLQWQWQANAQIQWHSILPGRGFLRLFAFPVDSTLNFWGTANLLLQKFSAPNFTATTKLNYVVEDDAWQGKKAGLVIMGNDYASLSIQKNAEGYFLNYAVCKNAASGSKEAVLYTAPLTSGEAWLRVTVSAPNAQCTFSFSQDGTTFTNINLPFIAKPGRWIGAKVGLFCTGQQGTKTGGYVDVDWFRVTPPLP